MNNGGKTPGGGGPDFVDIVDDQKIIAFDLYSGGVELTCLEEALLKGCGFGNMDLRSPQIVSDCFDCVPLGVFDDDAGSYREGADRIIEVELIEEWGEGSQATKSGGEPEDCEGWIRVRGEGSGVP